MELTNLTALAAPPSLGRWADGKSDATVDEHRIEFNGDWWRAAFAAAALPEDLVTGDSISRGDLLRLADGADRDPLIAERLLWNAIVWGLGNRPRHGTTRLRQYTTDRARHQGLLVKAAALAKISPEDAYATLFPGQTAIPHLGPSFLTKYLYAAGQNAGETPCLILDERVVASLQAAGWRSLRSGGGWPAATYLRYVSLAQRWATDVGLERSDLVEQFLFECNGDLT